MRPEWLKTQIFLDSGDPRETERVLKLLGFLDGQTTNPTLVARNPEVQKRLGTGNKFTKDELLSFYRETVQEITRHIPGSSISIETYADHQTTADVILEQVKEMSGWVPNAHIKMPINGAGLEAARKATTLGIKVNMTLCFTQRQAVAVYMATTGARRGDVFVSPFIGRLDDIGLMGTDLTENIQNMFYDPIHHGDEHVMVLSASVRDLTTFLHEIKRGVDIITSPLKVLEEWAKKGFSRPGSDFCRYRPQLKKIRYDPDVNFATGYYEIDIAHELTDKGIDLFSNDWNSLLKEKVPVQKELPTYLL